MPHQLPAAGAVDLGGFIQLGIDAGEGREVDDRAVTGLFPEVLTDDHRREELGIGHDVGGVLFAEHLDQHMIGDTVGGGEELIGQRRHNHDGDEVRDIHQRLGKALEPFAAQLVEQQCEDDRRREGEDQVGQRDCQRVAQQTPEIRAGEEFFKVLQSGEGAAEQRLDGGVAIVGAEVLERHDQACHRRVVENEHVQDARDHQNVQPVMLHERFAPGVVPELRISAFVLLGPSTGRFTCRQCFRH